MHNKHKFREHTSDVRAAGAEQAAAADALFAAGVDRGPLQGIPYGLKDLIAVEGYRTTWGAPAFIQQTLPGSAAVYERLRSAGAVLVRSCATLHLADLADEAKGSSAVGIVQILADLGLKGDPATARHSPSC